MIFKVGKSREKMSLTEFIRQAVNYDYLLRYRNFDFTGRQAGLEEFVIKMIYQGEKILVSSMALKIRLTRFAKNSAQWFVPGRLRPLRYEYSAGVGKTYRRR